MLAVATASSVQLTRASCRETTPAPVTHRMCACGLALEAFRRQPADAASRSVLAPAYIAARKLGMLRPPTSPVRRVLTPVQPKMAVLVASAYPLFVKPPGDRGVLQKFRLGNRRPT